MKTILMRVSLVGILFAMFGALLMPNYASAQDFDPLEQACKNVGSESNDLCNNPIAGEDPLLSEDGVLAKTINILSLVTAVVATIILIVSGIRMITSSGDANAVSNARNTIIYAAVGIVIVVMAQTIVQFIAGRLG